MRQSIFSYKNNVNEYFYTEHRNAAKMITTITYCRNVIAGLCTNSSYTQKANNHPYWRTHTQTTHAYANVSIQTSTYWYSPLCLTSTFIILLELNKIGKHHGHFRNTGTKKNVPCLYCSHASFTIIIDIVSSKRNRSWYTKRNLWSSVLFSFTTRNVVACGPCLVAEKW